MCARVVLCSLRQGRIILSFVIRCNTVILTTRHRELDTIQHGCNVDKQVRPSFGKDLFPTP